MPNTCQVKGRVERANKTLQDKLIKELRLLGISTAQEANEYLPEFIRMYNQKLAKQPRSETNIHRALYVKIHLNPVLLIASIIEVKLLALVVGLCP